MAETKKAAAAPKTTPTEAPDIWQELTKPFPSDWVEKLPKPLKGRDEDKGRCSQGSRYTADGHACGGWHARAVHLDYVGHAGITMRLNDVLGPGGWDFTPYAETGDGLPAISTSTFWAKLTIRVPGQEPVTKWDLAANYNGPQEALGDALRRCAMRFGIGTYLWAKSEHAAELASMKEPEPERPAAAPQAQRPERDGVPVHVQMVYDVIGSLAEEQKVNLASWWDQRVAMGQLPPRENMAAVTPDQAAMVEDAVVAILESTSQAKWAAAKETAGAAQGPQ